MLLIMRLVGGVGGAGNGPATFSMLGDLFPPAKLPKAMATMNIGFMRRARAVAHPRSADFLRAGEHAAVSLPVIGELRPWQVVFLDHRGSRPAARPAGPRSRCTSRSAAARGLPLDAAGAGARPPVARAGYGHLRLPVGEPPRVLAHVRRSRDSTASRCRHLVLDGAASTSAPSAGGRTSSAYIQGWCCWCSRPLACCSAAGWPSAAPSRGVPTPTMRVVVWASLAHIPFARLASAWCRIPMSRWRCSSLNTCVIGHRHRTAERRVPGHRAERNARPDHGDRSCSCSRSAAALGPVPGRLDHRRRVRRSEQACATRWR